MNRLRLIKTAYTALACLMLTACASDELTDGTVQDLPEGKYPLQIAGVSITAESNAEPWGADAPQTRMAENTTDGKNSYWVGEEIITVQLSGTLADGTTYTETGEYRVAEDDKKSLAPVIGKELYWHSTSESTITSWYCYPAAAGDNTVDLSNQNNPSDPSSGLAYVLKSEASNVNYNTQPELKLKHQLAKVRVVLEGSEKGRVDAVSVYTYPACKFTPNDAATKITGSGNPEYIPMKKTTYDNGTTCWEANVVPGITITKVKIGDGECQLNNSGVTPVVGKWHLITINVEKKPIDFSEGDATITNDGNYRITGDNSNKEFIIQSPSGGWAPTINATITLENTTLESILLTEASTSTTINATFIIKGTVTVSKGIVTKCGGRVIVKGTEEGKLIIGNPDTYNPAIGNLEEANQNVELKIEDITIEATGAAGAAVIGTSSGWSGAGSVGNLTIKNSDLTLKAVASNGIKPAVIGTGGTDSGELRCGDINIYLKEGQSQEQFLQNLTGDYNQQVGVGSVSSLGSVSCGSINWYQFDGSPIN